MIMSARKITTILPSTNLWISLYPLKEKRLKTEAKREKLRIIKSHERGFVHKTRKLFNLMLSPLNDIFPSPFIAWCLSEKEKECGIICKRLPSNTVFPKCAI